MNALKFLSSKFTLIQGRLSKIRLCYAMTILLIIATNAEFLTPSSCEVFCRGKLLDVVQKANLNDDDKYFVDMKMKFPKSVIFAFYYSMMNETDGKPYRVQVRRFVRKCFAAPGSELERCKPKDWSAHPKLVSNIHDDALKNWALELNKLWKLLCRKTRQDVNEHPDMYSALYVPNIFIIPGGRRREYYYWDSYWIVLGLLHSDMYSTAKGMIENLLYLIEKYGFVPNGGRVYYLGRSQVPLLIPMVDIYYNRTNDKEFLTKHVCTLEKELNFWMDHRVVEVSSAGKTFKLARYSAAEAIGPRPEEYKKDAKFALPLKTEEEKYNFFRELKAACEAGWNFSSRWYINNNNTADIQKTKTRSIIPVDLNAILFLNAQLLSEFFSITGDGESTAKYKNIAETWMKSVTKLLWSEEDGAWFDYDVSTKELRKNFYTSNVVPLWTGCYDRNQKDKVAEKVVTYLTKNNVGLYKGGVPSSLLYTGHRWDFPNALPCSQYMLIKGLENTKNDKAAKLAFKIANYWIRANYIGFASTDTMQDTYDVTIPGMQGAGDTFKSQIGYGWTNGVILDLLNTYGKRVNVQDLRNSALSMTPLLSVTRTFFQVYLIFLFNGGNFNVLS